MFLSICSLYLDFLLFPVHVCSCDWAGSLNQTVHMGITITIFLGARGILEWKYMMFLVLQNNNMQYLSLQQNSSLNLGVLFMSFGFHSVEHQRNSKGNWRGQGCPFHFWLHLVLKAIQRKEFIYGHFRLYRFQNMYAIPHKEKWMSYVLSKGTSWTRLQILLGKMRHATNPYPGG